MTEPTAYEQYLLELMNRARLHPAGGAAREGIDLNAGLAAGTIGSAAKQPLAWNASLTDAARAHSGWMESTGTFSHTGVNATSPGERMPAAGYKFTGSWSGGENIAWQGTTGAVDLLGFTTAEYDGLFKSA